MAKKVEEIEVIPEEVTEQTFYVPLYKYTSGKKWWAGMVTENRVQAIEALGGADKAEIKLIKFSVNI